MEILSGALIFSIWGVTLFFRKTNWFIDAFVCVANGLFYRVSLGRKHRGNQSKGKNIDNSNYTFGQYLFSI